MLLPPSCWYMRACAGMLCLVLAPLVVGVVQPGGGVVELGVNPLPLPLCYNTCCEAKACGSAAVKAGKCPSGTTEHLQTCVDPCCISDSGDCCRLGNPPGGSATLCPSTQAVLLWHRRCCVCRSRPLAARTHRTALVRGLFVH